MSKHTTGKLDAEGVRLFINNEDGRRWMACTMHASPVGQRPIAEVEREAEANAARFALCWNCHDGLLAALKEWVESEDQWDDDPEPETSEAAIERNKTVRLHARSRAAIAKVEALDHE